ncbi:MAG TPA: nicotinate phosphoribosyltransferase [Actinomycetota bacterium]
MPGALLSDLYELNMAASYLRRGMHAPATFSLYVRGLPKRRGFLVAAGLEACLDFLESVSFDDDDLAYLSTVGFDDRAIEDFRGLRFDGEVWAVPEGRIVYSEEPILEVTAPVAVGQLVETYLLNQITLHTTLATKAARYVLAADGRDLVDFAFRRTHGIEAAMAIARASAMVGFAATSNVEAAHRYGLRVAGTMAHSFIEAFPTEREAFLAFAEDHPTRTTFLVDTYDTLNGVRNAIDVIRELDLGDHLGVRLDSGDLDALARGARALLDEAGLTDARIFASGGLDELEVYELVKAGAPVDAFGIGTQMGVSADAPYVDSVYKLTEYDGEPKLKLSSDKATAPGRKQVWRSSAGDLLALRDEAGPDDGEALLSPVMRDGRRLAVSSSLDESRERFRADLAGVPTKARRLTHPEHVVVPHSAALRELTAVTRAEALRRSVEGA